MMPAALEITPFYMYYTCLIETNHAGLWVTPSCHNTAHTTY